ncbi:MAG: STAS domain-containing protein, partial [Actinomycetota bacterium]
MSVETPFFVAVRHELGGVPVIRVSGEVCIHTAPRLRSTLQDAIRETGWRDGRAAVVVDLGGVSFMDSTGISVLLGETRAFREAGGELRL